MHEQTHGHRNADVWLLALMVVLCLAGLAHPAWASGPGAEGPVATPQPWEWSPVLMPDGQTLAASPALSMPDPAPTQLAETFTSRPFWIVLALVVLGSIVLMSDFPDTN